MGHLKLELLGTSGCHLCDEAEQVLTQHLNLSHWQVEVVDVSESDELMAQYALRIPVLKHPTSKQCLDWPFDNQRLADFVRKL